VWISSLAAEVDAVDLVDDVAQQVAADHAVLHALEDVGHDLALAAFLAARRPGRADRRTGPCRAAIGTWLSSWLMKASSSSPVMPSSRAAQSRQRYGASMMGW
jgi:hypothetical protein